MTGDVLRSPLGRRLLAAFLLVALSSVAVLTVAALVATSQGLAESQRSEREQVAARVADAAAAAYVLAGGWVDADLSSAAAIADAAGARLAVQDASGTMIWPGRGQGPGAGGMQAAAGVVTAPVEAAGVQVGTVRIGFASAVDPGRTVAWSWVIGAAAVAMVAALAVSGYVVRRLTRALTSMSGAASRFAAGDRAARAAVDSPGELGELGRALDAMADEVVRAEQTRRQLAADVAHELRTPLAALQAGLEEVRDGMRAPDPPTLGALHDQTLRLARVVHDLADLSAAEAAAMSLRPIPMDLADAVAAALASQRPSLDAAGLRVRTDLRAAVARADPDRLHQVVVNLLTNVARYCRPGDSVDVRVRTENRTAVLEVADTGPGIPTDELPHIFDRLWRGRGARTVTGSGIGLAVVRELVAAHGGSVDARSPADGGTTITVRLPLLNRSTNAPDDGHADGGGWAPPPSAHSGGHDQRSNAAR